MLRGLFDHKIVIAHQFHGGDAFVFGVEAVLDGGAEMLGKHFRDPPGLHGGGEAEQGQGSGAAGGHVPQVGGDKKGGVLNHAFAHELALALTGQVAGGLAGFAAFGELIHKAGHEATA